LEDLDDTIATCAGARSLNKVHLGDAKKISEEAAETATLTSASLA